MCQLITNWSFIESNIDVLTTQKGAKYQVLTEVKFINLYFFQKKK